MQYSNLPTGLLDCFTSPDGITHTHDGTLLSIKADFWDSENRTVAVSYTLSRAAGEGDQSLLSRNVSDSEERAKLFIGEVAALGELPAPFGQVFNPSTMSEDRLLHWLMRSSLISDESIKDAASNRGVLLLGDAAHAQPIPGNGGNLAIDDAVEAAKHVSATGDFDVDAFLQARSAAWMSEHWRTCILAVSRRPGSDQSGELPQSVHVVIYRGAPTACLVIVNGQ
jgi:2-polyprenyl-6-methoxyphenol hydroxylase-like FAD-dependent oxidoreductase